MVTINITQTEINALSNLAYAEGRSLEKYGMDGAYGAVADTVLNRVAAKTWYGKSIVDVIEKPWQFTPLNGLSGWEDLRDAPRHVVDYMQAHIEGRANGEPSLVGQATHYLNPAVSDANALNAWAKGLKGVTLHVGSGGNAHYFLNPPGERMPKDYTIIYKSGQAYYADEAGNVLAPAVEVPANLVITVPPARPDQLGATTTTTTALTAPPPRTWYQKIGDGIKGAAKAVGTAITKVVGKVADAVRNVVSRVAEAVSDTVKKIAQAVSDTVKRISKAVSDTMRNIKSEPFERHWSN